MLVQDFNIYRGDDYIVEIAVINDDGSAVDLTNTDVKLGFNDGNGGKMSYADITVENNVVTAHFKHETTKNLTYSRAKWDLQLTKDSIVTTVARGNINITKDITP